MDKLVWSDDLSINNPDIDAQHKNLFDITNKLMLAIINASPKEAIAEIIDNLEEYAKVHFASEEDYMRSIGFEAIDEHIKLHNVFKDRVVALKTKFNSGQIYLKLETFVFIKDWLIKHVSVADQKIK